ncbi:MAG: DUF853 family protein [Acidobacteria bacterium]|nr:DUF853 family protein [Acidobacteriota bacterium]
MSQVLIGGSSNGHVFIRPALANRHGLIAGATGTGKTVTLQILAEGFSRLGVPVFLADVKGDLSGLSQPMKMNDKVQKRLDQIGIDDYQLAGYPLVFWDLLQELGFPVRTTISEMGPILLARLLELNDTQEGVLNIAFRVADDEGMALLDFKDLHAILQWVAEQAETLTVTYGNVSKASVGAVLRRLLVLEEQGADLFFGEPALDLKDFMGCDRDGRGLIHVLAAENLMMRPRLYSTFLLWLLAELFEDLPEAGDLDRPKLVFFFDEAHLLFEDAPKSLVDQIEQVVRLIRSKGVGVYFVTQNPTDVPDEVLGQLGHRVQHALRAYTPRDQKTVRVAASTFRQNPNLNPEEVITQLGVGEALVSVLDEKGVPTMVERVLVRPPESRIGPASPDERRAVQADNRVGKRYERTVDRLSAFELLKKRRDQMEREAQRAAKREAEEKRRNQRRPSRRQSSGEAFVKSAARSIGTQMGRSLVRGILGAIKRAF